MNNGQVPFENLSGPKIRECRYDYDVLKVYRKDGTWQTLTANRYKESGTGSHSLTVDQRYLQSISWKTGAISLEYGSNGDMLTKLIVKNNQTNTVRTVTFDQSGTREQRKLNSLIIDKDTYSFNYYNRIPPGACVPDYWGYASYSPLLGGSGQIPNHSVDLKIGYQYAVSTDGRSDSATPKTATVGTANIGSITQAYSYEPIRARIWKLRIRRAATPFTDSSTKDSTTTGPRDIRARYDWPRWNTATSRERSNARKNMNTARGNAR